MAIDERLLQTGRYRGVHRMREPHRRYAPLAALASLVTVGIGAGGAAGLDAIIRSVTFPLVIGLAVL